MRLTLTRFAVVIFPMQLAQEYLQTQTEINCPLQAKQDLESQLVAEANGGPLGDSNRFLQELRERQSENVSVLTKIDSNCRENKLIICCFLFHCFSLIWSNFIRI